MTIQELVSKVRDSYVAQFESFVRKENAACAKGSSEVQLHVGGEGSRYRNLYRADFVCTDSGNAMIELIPDTILQFEPLDGFVGDTRLQVESLCWDNIDFEHDAGPLPEEAVSYWFETWFDPDDARRTGESEDRGLIHVLHLEPSSVGVDFGTASPDAFWDLFRILLNAGALSIRISTSRTA